MSHFSHCPHCGAAPISPMAKLRAVAAVPQRCSACGNLAYLPARETRILNAIVYPGCLLVLAAIFFIDAWIPIGIWAALWLAALLRVVWNIPFVVASEAQASQGRHGNALLAVLVVAWLLHWMFSDDEEGKK